MIPGLKSLSTANPIFSGGLGLMAIGGAITALKSIPKRAWHITQSKLYCDCILENDDNLFWWMELWLSKRPEMSRAGNLRVITRYRWDYELDCEINRPYLSAGDAEYIITFQGVKFWLTIHSEKTEMVRDRIRVVRIRCRKRYRPVLEALLNDVSMQQLAPEPNILKVYLPAAGNWERHATRRKRAPESLVLPAGVWEYVYEESLKFVNGRSRYDQLNIPYRFGIELDGAPGNGKSTLAATLAGALDRPLYVLNIGDAAMTDERFVSLMGGIPQRAVVAIEDIDTTFEGRKRVADNKLTFSSVLNSIDGPTATEGRILIITTNRHDALDSALIRPGRCDIRVTINNANADQAKRMFLRFFEGADTAAEQFATWAGDGTRSMAALQAHLLERINDPARAAEAP